MKQISRLLATILFLFLFSVVCLEQAVAKDTVYSGNRAVRIWHQEGGNTCISRYLGWFNAGDTVSVNLSFRTNAGANGQVFLGDAGGVDPYDNYVGGGKRGNGAWQSLNYKLTLTHGDDVWIYMYGNVSVSDPANITSVIYDDITVTSAYKGLLWTEGFECRFNPVSNYWDKDSWNSFGQTDWITAPTESKTVSLRHGEGNVCISRYVGKFNQGDTISVSIWFKTDTSAYGGMFLGDTGATRYLPSYNNYVGGEKRGNGTWQCLNTSLKLNSDDDIWLYLYAPASDTTVIYDDITINSVQKGYLWTEGFENGFNITSNYWDTVKWNSFGTQNKLFIDLNKPFTFWQLPSEWDSIINSYVIQTGDSTKVIVMDGGMTRDAVKLKDFLNNKVSPQSKITWFISHQHSDHIGALTELLDDPAISGRIDKIYGSRLEMTDIDSCATEESAEKIAARNLDDALEGNSNYESLTVGKIIEINGVIIEVLGIKNPEIKDNFVNNSSVVLRVSDTYKSVLFTGDLGDSAAVKLINGPYRSHVIADYVQMAHHGQGGVNQDFYNLVSPKYCIWPTPSWLWPGNPGYISTYTTDVTIGWMNNLNIIKHFRMFDSVNPIEIKDN